MTAPRNKTYVSGDGMVSLRTKPMDEGKAKRLAALWDACPSFLSAWVEKLPNSTRVSVCYIPATLESQEAMTEAFLQGELDKAADQGKDFLCIPYKTLAIGGMKIKIINPHTGGKYWIQYDSVRGGLCSCPWCRRAGVCKHLIEAASRGLIEPPAEYRRKDIAEATETNLESRGSISEATRLLDFS